MQFYKKYFLCNFTLWQKFHQSHPLSNVIFEVKNIFFQWVQYHLGIYASNFSDKSSFSPFLYQKLVSLQSFDVLYTSKILYCCFNLGNKGFYFRGFVCPKSLIALFIGKVMDIGLTDRQTFFNSYMLYTRLNDCHSIKTT